MITSHNTCYPLEFPFNYTNRLSLLEFLHLISRYNDIIRICFTDYAKTLNLIVRDNQWLDFIADVEVTIVKTKIMEVYVIVNKRLDFFFCAISKEEVGNTRFFYCFTFTIYKFNGGKCRIEGCSTFTYNIIVCFLFSSVSGT